MTVPLSPCRILLLVLSLSACDARKEENISPPPASTDGQPVSIAATASPVLPAPVMVAPPYPPLSFKGYTCTIDCSGHEAGYTWAEEHAIDDPEECSGNSESFIEGCRAYAEEQNETSNSTDNEGHEDEDDE